MQRAFSSYHIWGAAPPLPSKGRGFLRVDIGMIVCHDGDVALLTDLLSSGIGWKLGLYNTAITPAEGDTAATYTASECVFTGYARKTLTRSIGISSWSIPILAAPSGTPPWSDRTSVAVSHYVSQTWTCGATGDSILGFFIITDEVTPILIGAQLLPGAVGLTTGGTYSLAAPMELA